jgi:hypothetical protein
LFNWKGNLLNVTVLLMWSEVVWLKVITLSSAYCVYFFVISIFNSNFRQPLRWRAWLSEIYNLICIIILMKINIFQSNLCFVLITLFSKNLKKFEADSGDAGCKGVNKEWMTPLLIYINKEQWTLPMRSQLMGSLLF